MRGTTPDAGRRFPPRKISAPRNCASPTIVASALQTASDQSGSTRSRARRISSGSAGASSAYSANFAAVTPCVCHAYADECAWPYATSTNIQSEEEPGGEPQPASASERREPVAEPAPDRHDHDGEHGEVREIGVEGGRAEPDAESGLVVDVQEEDRDRRREHERPGRHRRRETPLPPFRCGDRAGRQGPATILASPDEPAPRTPFRHGCRYLLVRCSRLPRHRRRGPRVPDDAGLRRLRDGHLRDELLPVVLRPDRRGGAREVRLPLRHAGGVGAAARALPQRVLVQADRLRARRDRAADLRRVRAVPDDLGAGRRVADPARAVARGPRRLGAVSAQPLRHPRRLPHVVDGATSRRRRDRRAVRTRRGDRRSAHRAGDRDRVGRRRRPERVRPLPARGGGASRESSGGRSSRSSRSRAQPPACSRCAEVSRRCCSPA